MVHQANREATLILNYTAPEVRAVADRLGAAKPSPRAYVQAAHRHLDETLGAVYSIEEQQSAAETCRRNGGSCSQRMSTLEALARAYGVPTRVRGIWLDRSFWFHRMPLLKPVLPKRTLMPWPQFFLDEQWVDFDELYATITELAKQATHPFTNRGESLYSAVKHWPVDLLGKLKGTPYARFDISNFVVGDEGVFDSRDELLDKFDPHTGWLGKLIFNVVYGGRNIRREPE